jgi:hypothetical protein
MNTGAITITIDRLTFEGLAAAQANVAGQAFIREFSYLLEKRGIPSALEKWSRKTDVVVDGFEAVAGGRPENVGREVARAMYWGLERGEAKGPKDA